jgi:hypothetical protein
MIDLEFLLLGWPSYLLYLSLFSLVMREYFGSLVLANWRNEKQAMRFRRDQKVFEIITRICLIFYSLILWFFGIALRDLIVSLAGLLLLTVVTLHWVLRRKYFLVCLLALSLFLIYSFILLQLTPIQSWF